MNIEPFVARISRNGQISLPAGIRRRWSTERVVVLDRGDHVVIRSLPDEPAKHYRGWFGTKGPTTDDARKSERSADVAIDKAGPRQRTTR